MWTASSVLVCALSVLGRPAHSMPPIALVDVAPPEVSAGAEAYVRRSTGTIYLITSSQVFREAAETRNGCGEGLAIKKLASILAHEEWHVRNGADEKRAYEYQLLTLIRLGVSPGSGVYHSVQRSMIVVVEARKRQRPEMMVAIKEF